MLSYTNAARASQGLSKLVLDSQLVAIARQHSAKMASKGTIFHNSSLPSQVSNWRKIGENVGKGPSAKSIQNAFMGSSSHRSHILDPAYDRVGIGAVWKGSGSSKTLYVTVVFVDRPGSSSGGSVSKPKIVYKTIPKRAKPKPRPAPPARPVPQTIDLLLQLVALDTGDEAIPMPVDGGPPVP